MSLTQEDLQSAAARLNCSVAIIRAIAMKESDEAGFKNGVIKRRFEPGKFKERTGKTAATFDVAYKINPTEAMKSSSWGMFQVMGFNYEAAGYSSVDAMVDDYKKGESQQLNSFVKLILAWKLDDELRGLKFAAIAKAYNGPNYKVNDYDTDIEKFYKLYSVAPLAGLEKKKPLTQAT